ncbi:MAG: hypothetical protein Q7S26_00425 [bacterium]|nr:hypothetical protein [bacterium]
MKKIALTTVALFAVPFVAFAAGGELTGINTLVTSSGTIIANLIKVLIGLALVVFFWGLIKYIWGGGKDTAKGKSIMIAGIIALFVMISIYGIISFAQNALLGGEKTDINIPKFPGDK